MIASGNEILAYIPQRFPIVMVSELYQADEKSADTGLFIEPENISRGLPASRPVVPETLVIIPSEL